ncbi:MAG: hypothetical protein K6G11_05160 [Lachnospiraceae bacterium]|nr:hypothetical protein [Lachnospiraceae bacterium]
MKTQKLKRFISLLLILVLMFSLVPVKSAMAVKDDETAGIDMDFEEEETTAPEETGSADSEEDSEDSDSDSEDPFSVDEDSNSSVLKSLYSVDVDGEAPTFQANKGMENWINRKSYKALANTYVLRVGTGEAAGSSILYFRLRYINSEGKEKLTYLFPNTDAMSRSEALIKYTTGNDENSVTPYGESLLKDLHYKEEYNETPLDSWTVQDYAFELIDSVSKLTDVDIYLSKGKWSTQGMTLFKAKKVRGYEEYGIISGQRFLDFEGYKIAEVINKKSAVTISTTGTDKIEHVADSEGNSEYCDIINLTDSGIKNYFASSDDVYTLRMDFLDSRGAGIESFINKKIKQINQDNGIVEDITVKFQYKDVEGMYRTITFPVILSSFAEARKHTGDSYLMGFAGRGETIAFTGYLPGFASIEGNVEISLGAAARTAIEKNGITMDNGTSKMNNVLNATTSDNVNLSGISIYKGSCMSYVLNGIDSDGDELQGASLEYEFENAEPLYYFTTSDIIGREIYSGKSTKLKLSAYKSGSQIIASTKMSDKFMITLVTSDIAAAGTKDDVSFKLYYKNKQGKDDKTVTKYVRNEAVDFMGDWISTDDDDFVYNGGMAPGGYINFLIDAPNLKNPTQVDLSLLGNDEWQMKDMVVSYLDSYGKRKAYISKNPEKGSYYWVQRSLESAEIFTLSTANTSVQDDSGNNISPDGTSTGEDEEEFSINRGEQLFLGGASLSFSFETGKANTVEEQDNYSEVRYKMSYEQTQINWGFTKKRKVYDVQVKVDNDSAYSNDNGDAGSVNYFYFQLIFKNGNSAYVLANQQISSDGFRSGKTETFTISTNRDYGNLVGIRIIPEEISDDTDSFDKLNIANVTISEHTNGGAYMLYVIDQVGWIDIDYRDEAEVYSARGRAARSADELSKIYKVTHKERAVNLLCEMTTHPWDNDYKPFEGSMLAEVKYVSSTTNEIETMTFDVVQRLADYMGKTAKSVEYETNPNVELGYEAFMSTVSDPDWMFRPSQTDRFVMPPLPDFKYLKSIKFIGMSRNGYPAIWNLGRITISQVLEDGAIQLTNNNEYYRNLKTERLCERTDSNIISTLFPIGSVQSTPEIMFTENEVEFDNEYWTTPVTRVPDSSDDKLNIFLYPSASNRQIGTTEVDVSLQYETDYSQMMQVSHEGMYTANSGTDDAVFYITGLKANNFASAGQIGLQCLNSSVAFDYAIVQHVRENVVMSTYQYEFSDSSAVLGLIGQPSQQLTNIDKTTEKIALSFGAGTENKKLIAEQYDVAVAFYYRSTIDDGAAEYRSPYIYLTDQGYTELREGLYAELEYDLSYVKKITGISVVSFGTLKANVDASCGVIYQIDEEVKNEETGIYEVTKTSKRGYTSFANSFAVTETETKYEKTSLKTYGDESVAPVAITFRTSEASALNESGTDSKVRMIFYYRDSSNNLLTKTFDDITPYIQDDTRKFVTGEEATVKIFLPKLNEALSIIAIDIMPYNGKIITDQSVESVINDSTSLTDGTSVKKVVESKNASWTISSVKCDIGYGDRTIEREVEQQFAGVTNGDRLRLNDVTLTTYTSLNGGLNQEVKDHSTNILAKGGDKIQGTVIVSDSTAGYNVDVYRMVGDAGEEISLSVLSNVKKRKFTFTTPENNTTDNVIYKIEISPVDAPDIKDVVYITVEKTETTAASGSAVN